MTTMFWMLPAWALVAALAGPAGAVETTPEQQRYDAARDEYEIGHFQVAFAEFAALADGGHCEAARMALQMVRHGKSLYAAEFRVPLERVQRWQHMPACGAAMARR